MEFGVVLFVLIACLILPLVSVAIIGVRVTFAQTYADQIVNKLSRCETLSDAFKELATGDHSNQLSGGLANSHIALVIHSYNNARSIEIQKPRNIPQAWLPGAAQCEYILRLQGDVEIPIPFLKMPIKIGIQSTAPWENFGRDPQTQQFYLNE